MRLPLPWRRSHAHGANGRVKVPTVLQMEALECGAASLGMILAYHGRYVPLEELRVECGVSRDGSRALYIVKAARRYGMESAGFRRDVEGLKRMPPPYIVFWEHNHFLVVEGFQKGKVFLNDPAIGPRVMSEDEFAQSYSGIVLTFKPTEQFERAGRRPSVLPTLWQRLKGNGTGLLYVFLVGLLLVVPGLVIPNFLRSFVDNVLLAGMSHWLPPLLIGMALTALLQGGLSWLQAYYLTKLEIRMAKSWSARFFWHVLRLPTQFFAQRFAGEVGGRVQLNDTVASVLGGRLSSHMLEAVTAVFFLAMMLRLSPTLTLIGVVAVILNILFARYMSEQNVINNQRLQQEQGKAMASAMAGLQAIETLKASGGEGDFFNKWAGYHTKQLNVQQRIGVLQQYFSAVPNLLTSLTTTAILALGSLEVMSGQLTLGGLVAFQALMQQFMGPVTSLVGLGTTIQELAGDVNRLEDVLKYPVQVKVDEFQRETTGEHPPKLRGHLELRNVTFGYNRFEPPLIEDFSLTLEPGKRIALVGGSGSGKSTVARLIAGLFEPWSGEIRFDGKPRDQWPRHVLYNSLAIVDQEIHMFEGTVRDNITLWDATIPEADIIQACKDACIHDQIMSRPGGYSARMLEGGRNFSGGERQRLEIARALVTNPSLLILDEATSALDPRTEMEIDQNLRRRGCACIIVAHRLSTIRDADEIIVMERGKIVQRGTHEQMIREDGPYARLVRAH